MVGGQRGGMGRLTYIAVREAGSVADNMSRNRYFTGISLRSASMHTTSLTITKAAICQFVVMADR